MTFRRLSTLLASTLLGAATAAAHAQLGVFGTVTLDHVTGIQCREATCGTNDGKVSAVGGGFGAFYDFRSVGPMRLGATVRGDVTTGNKNAAQFASEPKPRVYSALGGVRLMYPVRLFHLAPYVEGAVGMARTNAANPLPANSNGRTVYPAGLQFRGFAGVDLPLLPFLDFRVVELGAGAVRNSGSTYPIQSISSGVVLHFPFNRD
jgi:hypothetical protein